MSENPDIGVALGTEIRTRIAGEMNYRAVFN
jgi:hypothetical protein